MKAYGLPADQLAGLSKSAHGPGGRGEKGFAAVCTDCHGRPMESFAIAGDRKIWDHIVRKPSDPDSSVHPVKVPATCARCHDDEKLMAEMKLPADAFAPYAESIHGRKLIAEKKLDQAPSCVTCHGDHDLRTWQRVEDKCGDCHAGMEFHFADYEPPAEVKARCTPCHGHHEIFTKDASKPGP
jgi:hypothetical protein